MLESPLTCSGTSVWLFTRLCKLQHCLSMQPDPCLHSSLCAWLWVNFNCCCTSKPFENGHIWTIDVHDSSRVMGTYHTHFGVPLGSQTGWWGDEEFLTIFNALSPESDSLVKTWMPSGSARNSTEFLASLESAINATGTVCKMKSTYF